MSRHAYWCTHKDHGELPVRIFLPAEPETRPRCPRGHLMARQENRPYHDPSQPVAAKPKAKPKAKRKGG
jgi:hypothetical protein